MKVPVVEKEDMKKAVIAAIIYAVLAFILLLFLSVSEPDPPIQDIPVPLELSPEMVIEHFEIESNVGTNGAANAGGGTPSSEVSKTPTPPTQGERVLTSDESDFTHTAGQNGNANVADPKPPKRNADETFTFGTGGNGGGAGTGNGTLFGSGNDNVAGTGTGGTGNGSRTVIQSPCPPSVGTEEGDIYLTVWIDDSGKVIKAENISSKTTTSSTAVINAAIKGVVTCMRFDKREGAPVVKMNLAGPIRIRRN